MSQPVEVRSNRESVAKILASRKCDSETEVSLTILESQRLFGEALMRALGWRLASVGEMRQWRNARGDTADARLIERVLEW